MFIAHPWRPRGKFRLAGTRAMLSFGFKSTGSQYLQHFYNNISHQVVGFYFGTTALGAYRLAYEIVLYPINWVSNVVAQVAFPAFARVSTRTRDLANQFLQFSRQNLAVALPILVLLLVAAHEFLGTFFPHIGKPPLPIAVDMKAWIFQGNPKIFTVAAQLDHAVALVFPGAGDISTPVRLLCIVGLLRAIDCLYLPLLDAMGYAGRNFAVAGLAAVVLTTTDIAFAVLLGPHMGFTAVALGRMIGYPIVIGVHAYLALGQLRLTPRAYLGHLAGLVACGAAAIVPGVLLGLVLPASLATGVRLAAIGGVLRPHARRTASDVSRSRPTLDRARDAPLTYKTHPCAQARPKDRILAGSLDGAESRPELREDVCGMPYVLRIAADLAHAGAKKIVVVWSGSAPLPTVDDLATDTRLRGASLSVVTLAPAGYAADPILIARADRIYHRDFPKLSVAAWRNSTAQLARVTADTAAAERMTAQPGDYDAIVVTDRGRATAMVTAAPRAGGLASAMATSSVATAEPPYLGFALAAPDRRALRYAEKRLVWSLRKQAQGIAAYWINRHISLPCTRAIMRTSILPNHVTVFCFLLALTGGIVIAQGGYVAGVIGMALVNLGSILDGVDGELARLKYRFSNIGAWLDTLADDFGNVAYVSGIAINLDKAGVTWAMPLALTALACFALTQSTQYFLITKVYKSGDLAAIPWAFQSTEFLTARPRASSPGSRSRCPRRSSATSRSRCSSCSR